FRPGPHTVWRLAAVEAVTQPILGLTRACCGRGHTPRPARSRFLEARAGLGGPRRRSAGRYVAMMLGRCDVPRKVVLQRARRRRNVERSGPAPATRVDSL